MVTGALEALVGGEPSEPVLAAALSTVPAADLPDALTALVRAHGAGALPLLGRCLAGRPPWAEAAAAALGRLPLPAAADLLAQAERSTRDRASRTAIRRALYRLRQAGITPTAPPATAPAPAAAPAGAWLSPVDGSGTMGLWLVVETPLGERTLLSAVVNDEVGILELAIGPVTKKRLDRELARLRAEGPLPWVAVPAAWALACLADAQVRTRAATGAERADLARWLARLPAGPAGPPPVYGRLDRAAIAADPTLLDRGPDLLALPEGQGWFLDPPQVQAAALELLQARESRLVVSDQIRAERAAAIVDRVVEAELPPEARARWQARLETLAWVLLETGRPEPARAALATALALADPARDPRHLAFVRALVERSLELAGEVALGRLSAAELSRRPRRPGPAA